MSADDASELPPSATFELGELVLARSKSLPYWPAHVRVCNADGNEHRGKWRIQLSDGRTSRLWCQFVNSPNSHAWVSVKLVKKFTRADADLSLNSCRTPNQTKRLKIAIFTAAPTDDKDKSDDTRIGPLKDPDNDHPEAASSSKPSQGATNAPQNASDKPNDVDVSAADTPHEGASAGEPHAAAAAPESVLGAAKPNRPQRRRKKAKVLEDFESLSEDVDVLMDDASSSGDDDDDDDDDDAPDGVERMDVVDATQSGENWHSGSRHSEDFIATHDTPPVPGTLVLAKTGSYPFWPARVMRCESEKTKWNNQWVLFSKKKPPRIWCSFIGDSTGGWVFLDKLRPYQPEAAEQLMSKPKSRLYTDHKNAVKLANEMHAGRKQLKIYPAGADVEQAEPPQAMEGVSSPQQTVAAPQSASPPTPRRGGKEPKYALGNIVLAKYDASCPYWPAKIAVCKEFNVEEGEDETQVGQWHREAEGTTLERFCCLFINDGSEAWVPLEVIKPFTASRAKKYLCSRNNELYGPQREAIAEATNLQKQKKINARRAVDGHWAEGDVVLARFEHCPFWPARVQKCELGSDEHFGEWKVSRGEDESLYWCSFLLNETCSWVPHGEIKPFTAARARHYMVNKNSELYSMQKEAIQLACQISDGKIFGDQVLDTSTAVEGATTTEPVRETRATGASTTEPVGETRAADIAQNEVAPASGEGASEPPQQPPEAVPSTPMRNADEEYKSSDVVLAKWSGTAFWPAQVMPCPSDTESRWKVAASGDEPEKFWVKFVNHEAERWVVFDDLKPFLPHRARRFMVNKTSPELQRHREAVRIASVLHKQVLENPDRAVSEADVLPLVKSKEAVKKEAVKKGTAKEKVGDTASAEKASKEAPAVMSSSPRAVTSEDDTKKKLREKAMSEKAVACKALENRRGPRKRKPRNATESDSDAANRRQELMKFDVVKYTRKSPVEKAPRIDGAEAKKAADSSAAPGKDGRANANGSCDAGSSNTPKEGGKGANESSVGAKRMRVEVVEASGNAKKRK